MEWINGMNAAVNYLEEHILEEPDLEKLGRLAGCSAHHFQRINAKGSTGLGLSIAKLLTEQMGGSIRAEWNNRNLSTHLHRGEK